MNKIQRALIKAKSDENKGLNRISSDDRNLITSDIEDMLDKHLVDSTVLSELKIIHQNMENKRIFNEFRTLRTSIMQKIQKNNICILIYSVIPGGGSSYVSANLAAAISLDNKKTALLINCDFKNPANYEKLLDDKTGLIDYLSDEIDINKIIHPTGIRRLRVIPSGETQYSFSEYFTSDKIKCLFAEIKARYSDRSIIIDASSANEVADIKLLMEVVDYALIVVPSGRCDNEAIRHASEIVEKEKLIGIVINNKQQLFSAK